MIKTRPVIAKRKMHLLLFSVVFILFVVNDLLAQEVVVSFQDNSENGMTDLVEVWSENFEGGGVDWFADNGVWQVGESTRISASPISGGKLAGTVLNGNYPDNTNSRFISPEIQLPNVDVAAGEVLQLRFWHWFSTWLEDPGVVQISVEGAEWDTVSNVFNWSSNAWTRYIVEDLTVHAGKRIRIGLKFFSNNSSTGLGWYVDDLSIVKGVPNWDNQQEDFSEGIGGWYTNNGVWEIGNTTRVSASPVSAGNIAATVLNSNYPDRAEARLISPVFQLPDLAAGEVLQVRMWHWFSSWLEDSGVVQISVDGSNWQTLSLPFNWASNAWTHLIIDISQFAGSANVRLGFLFTSNASSTGLGWYIDDISIVKKADIVLRNPEDFEKGIGDWHTDNGVWEVGTSTVIPDRDNRGQVAGTVLNGNYPDRAEARLISPEFSLLPEPGETPRLRFLHWFSTWPSDSGEVQISVNNGDWQRIAGPFSGAAGAWSQFIVPDLSPYVSSNVRLGFLFTSNTSSTARGWYIDNINIEGIPPPARLVSIPDTTAQSGTTIRVPVHISDATGFAGAEIVATFNQNILTATDVQLGSVASGFSLSDTLSPGRIAISMARATGLSGGSGSLAFVTFNVTGSPGDTTTIALESVSLFDANTDVIESATQNGLFTVLSGTTGELTKITVSPPSDSLDVGQSAVFTASGEDNNGAPVSVNPTWQLRSNYGNIGSTTPTSGGFTTFTASGPGDGFIVATHAGLKDSALIVVTGTRGDINIDDIVNVQDAILCLQIIVDLWTPSPYQFWAADFDGNGDPLEDDALDILRKSLDRLLPKHTQVNSNYGIATVRFGQFRQETSDIVTVTVKLEGRHDVYAAGFEFDYDSDRLTILEVTPTEESTLIAHNFRAPGHAKVSLVGSETLVNFNGDVILLKFRAKNGLENLPAITISEVRLFDELANSIDSEVVLGMETTEVLPKEFALAQNYPNPFNPTTTITYRLPEDSRIRLTVFNILGQKVKTLFEGSMKAGTHTTTWDALNDFGHQVPSGIYVYRLEVEDRWQQTRKMVLLK